MGINLLASVWIWLYQQSGHVRRRIDRQLGGTIDIVSENEEGGGGSIRDKIDNIAKAAISKIRHRAVIGVGVAATASGVILLVSFGVKDDYPLCGSAWWWALILTFVGPTAMAIAWFSIRKASSDAVTQSNNMINDVTNELRGKKPKDVPRLSKKPA